MKFHLSLAVAALALSTVAQAEQIVRPGLWEMSTSNMQISGQQVPSLDSLMQQIGSLPPEQKQRMEDVLARQGMALGNKGMRVCLSEKQVQRDTLMLHDQGQDCSQQVTDRSGGKWAFTFQCPQAQGEGTAEILNDQEFVSHVKGQFTVQGAGPQQGSMDYRGRWVSADCGDLKPAR
ncbi:DUF3617 domain-containing protein [Pseudomonas matsuisoli]|uniref:DUF3617 domain-containing protein n=1 Tax=Pseudomonas matsuisoli TaxID=1515666 RepID=A0A917PW13_9PSED|nr:DUF3617 domain-containing protein [Pseudomonas matsuisoli]GGJ94578.1 hypothetical protein GCM10009304_20800 [Pseudomonas matsuisoli]